MTTIARGLVTLKRNKVSFTSDLRDAAFSGVFRNGVEISTARPVKEFSEGSRRNIQSFKDRLAEEFKLRCAINRANAKHTIQIGNMEMSINDALTYRTHVLPQLKALYAKMQKDLAANRSLFVQVEREFDAKMLKTPSDDAEFKTLLEKREKPTILDIQEELDEIKKTIDFFELEFDAILTENNPLIVLD
ncbi:tail fiber protein [Acinetobacter phage ZZ1]|uniref:Uncharacterized protein n=1 Tax=Acinetobacter phage ZZ1 TaxID=1049283 RepID=G0YKC5_9CAUD|nr:tail fiber protein [Acinetobacter phage ZZ1]AEJ90204.1 hypothetical protein ZZ1p0150 [Acinetobacter phage ZZ1]